MWELKKDTRKQPNETLYTRVLLWAHDKQESGFTWQELETQFSLTDAQMNWIRKIFLTASDSDRKFFEILRSDERAGGNVYYYALNEKGMAAAVSYRGLEHAEKASQLALSVAIVSILFNLAAVWFSYEQTHLTEIQSRSDRIQQAQMHADSVRLCIQNPELNASGQYETGTGREVSCKELLQYEHTLQSKLTAFFGKF